MRPLAIIGMRRSGTSSISLALSRLGVWFGEDSDLYGPDEFNAEGYFEHKALASSHRKFMLSMNLATVDRDPLPADWEARPATKHFISRGATVLKTAFGGRPSHWGWKDPDASACIPFVESYHREAGMESPHYLICVRHPHEVAQSQNRRTNTPLEDTYAVWVAQTLLALHGTEDLSRQIVHFDHYIKSVDCLGPTLEAINLRPNAEQFDASRRSFRPDLVTSVREAVTLPRFVEDLYSVTLEGTKSDIRKDVTRLVNDWLEMRSICAVTSLPPSNFTANWIRGSRPCSAVTRYVPNRKWQSVKLTIDAFPATSVSIQAYHLPASIWVKDAVWHVAGNSLKASVQAARSGQFRTEFGIPVITVMSSGNQFVVKTPHVKGPYVLEFEFLLESNSMLTAELFNLATSP